MKDFHSTHYCRKKAKRTVEILEENNEASRRTSKDSMEESLSLAVRPSMLSSSYQADLGASIMNQGHLIDGGSNRPSNVSNRPSNLSIRPSNLTVPSVPRIPSTDVSLGSSGTGNSQGKK